MPSNRMSTLPRGAVTARDSVLSAVQLFASASEQRDYERNVPLAVVPSELAEAAHDLFQPRSATYLDSFRLGARYPKPSGYEG